MAKKGRPFKADYTAEDVVNLYQLKRTEGEEGRLRGLISVFRKLCKMRHRVDVPKEYAKITKVIKTPFIRDAHHRIAASMVQKSPLVHITPKDANRKEYRDAASIGERFDQALIERMDKERGESTWWELTQQAVRDGSSVLKVVHKPSAWANFPERRDMSAEEYNDEADLFKRGADLPIAWRDVDRLTTVWEDGEYGDEWVIESGEYARPYLAAKYKMIDGPDGGLVNPKNILSGKPAEEGDLESSGMRHVKHEFFSPREWHVVIDGQEAPGWPKPNPYGELNYFRAKAPDSESLLYSMMFLVPGLDRLLTMKQAAAYLYAYPTPIIEQVPNAASTGEPWPDGDDGLPVKFTLKTGQLLQLPLGWTIRYLVSPAAGNDLNEMIGIYRALIDVAGIPSVFRGVGGSDQAGYSINQLIQAAQVAYQILRLSLQHQGERAFEFTHRMIHGLIRQAVYVHGWDDLNRRTGRPTKKANQAWLGLTDERKGGVNLASVTLLGPVNLSYRPTLPTDLQALAMTYNQLVNSPWPLMDRMTALERMQEEDPDSILDRIYVERETETNPILKQTVVENALRDAGMLPQPTSNPAALLVGPDGRPLMTAPGGQPTPNIPDQAPAPGIPSVQGLNTPMKPMSPGQGGRPAGNYPGQPGGPHR